MSERLTHLREDGSAHMVDVSDKAVTKRVATEKPSSPPARMLSRC